MNIKNHLRTTRRQRPKFRKLAAQEAASDPQVIGHQLAQLNRWRSTALGDAKAVLGGRRVKTDPNIPDRAVAATSWRVSAEQKKRLREDAERVLDEVAKADLDVALLHARRFDWPQAWANADAAAGHLRGKSARAVGLRALARYMTGGNTPALRGELDDAITAGVATSGLISMQSRLLTMVGDFAGAWATLYPHLHSGTEVDEIAEIVSPEADKPWLKFPCNYYTYRHALITHEQIAVLRGDDSIALGDAESARAALVLDFHESWNQANALMERRRYARAIGRYKEAVQLAESFRQAALQRSGFGAILAAYPAIKTHFADRYKTLTLTELYDLDWTRPHASPAGFRPYQRRRNLAVNSDEWRDKWMEKVASPILTIAYILIPFAIAEAAKALRQYGDSNDVTGRGIEYGALASIRKPLKLHLNHKLMSEFIERPFAALLKAQVLIAKGDAQYRSHEPDPSPTTEPDPATGAETVRFQGLKAARSYQGAVDTLTTFGQYVNRSRNGLQKLQRSVRELTVGEAESLPPAYHGVVLKLDDKLHRRQPVERRTTIASDSQVREFGRLGQDIGISTVTYLDSKNSGNIWLPPIMIHWPEDSPKHGDPLSEQNPLVYALILSAMSRLQQLSAGLNFLGYQAGFVPPWRFHYLLDRARYFAQHTRQIQNNYLNFLASAEREELSELQARNNVELEQSNVVLENQRLNQARAEADAATASLALAELSEDNATERLEGYQTFDSNMDRLQRDYLIAAGFEAAFNGGAATIGVAIAGAGVGGVAGGAIAGYFSGPGAVAGATLGGLAIGALAGGVAGVVTGGGASISQWAQKKFQMDMQSEQRHLELRNLGLAIKEAEKQTDVAAANLLVAGAGVEVASAGRAVAVMRQEFARQTMEFLQNRTTNAELWYRLADQIRFVSERYLQYAIELAFLAEQAYEFESGDRLDVIRFDYGIGDTGDYLGGDFLIADLDMLEHQYIVNAEERQQQFSFVVSLARDYPDVMAQLRDNSNAVLHFNLQALEQRFPGVYNCRVSSIGVQPYALMDPTRFAMQVTCLGSGVIRSKSGVESDSFAAVSMSSWCSDADENFPVRVQVSKPQTEVFSGMSRQQALVESPLVTAQQRAGFEGLAAASSWYLDFSTRENRVNPQTLADLVVTFNLTGYHSDRLKTRISDCLPLDSVQTLQLSGKSWYPDTYYEFQQRGRMEWEVAELQIPSGLQSGRLRNLGVRLLAATPRPNFGRVMAAHRVDFSVDGGGQIELHNPVPRVSMSVVKRQLNIAVAFEGQIDEAFWNFGDAQQWFDAPLDGSSITHVYPDAGSHTLTLRMISSGQLWEYTYAIAVSNSKDLAPCMTTYPAIDLLSLDGNGAKIRLRHRGSESGQAVMHWSVADQQGEAHSQATIEDLQIGKRYSLKFLSVRNLAFRLWSAQRFKPDQVLQMSSLFESSNRQFDEQGQLTSTNTALGGNLLSKHLFLNLGEMGARDTWHLTISAEDNAFLEVAPHGVNSQLDLSDIGDAILSLEYDATTIF